MSIRQQTRKFSMAALALTMLASLAFLAGSALPSQAQIPSPIPIYQFYEQTIDPPTNVYGPSGYLAQGRDGNIYGAVGYGGYGGGGGGANYQGGIWVMTPSGNESMIASIPGGWNGCESGLTLGPDGNFYGACTLAPNGNSGNGLVYQVTPAGVLSMFHEFTDTQGDYAPNSPPIAGPDGYLYGVTSGYGPAPVCGNFYRLSVAGEYKGLLNFSPSGDGNCHPSNLFLGSDGNFYGTLAGAVGFGDNGAVFKISTAGKVKIVYGFGANGITTPVTGVTEDRSGNLYGSTDTGGTGNNNNGVVYRVTTAGKKFTVLQNIVPDSDGDLNTLFEASNGNFYGYGLGGGISDEGSIYELAPTKKTYTFSNYLFDSQTSIGWSPFSPLMQHTNGTIYGTLNAGVDYVDYADGRVFELDADAPAFITPLPVSGKNGTEIGILGQGFTTATDVSFNGTSAAFSVDSDTYITAIVPTGATTGYVTVTTGTTTLKSLVKFKVKG